MANTPKSYTTESEVAALIAEMTAAGKPLEVAVGKERYTLELASKTRKRPDSKTVKRSIAGIKKASGGWKGFDVDGFLEYIYERRDAVSTRPPVKL